MTDLDPRDPIDDARWLRRRVQRLTEENERLRREVAAVATCQACGNDDASQHLCLDCLESGEQA